MVEVDRVNEEAGRKVIDKVIVKTNARRFVTSVQVREEMKLVG